MDGRFFYARISSVLPGTCPCHVLQVRNRRLKNFSSCGRKLSNNDTFSCPKLIRKAPIFTISMNSSSETCIFRGFYCSFTFQILIRKSGSASVIMILPAGKRNGKTDHTVLQAGIRTVHKTIPHTEAPRGKAYFFATPFPELPRKSANGTFVPMALCFSRHGLF